MPSGIANAGRSATAVEPEQGEDLVDRLVLARARAFAEAGEVARHAEQAFAAVLHPPGEDEVLAHGELGEQLHALEGARRARGGRGSAGCGG